MSFTVTIVRHGQTDFNLNNLVHTSSPGTINDTGRAEAEKLGIFLTDEKYTRVYSSDYQRCQDTAQGVLKNLKNSAPEVVLDERLRERDYAEWDGRPMKDLFTMAKEQNLGFKGMKQLSAPGGETWDEAADRVANFFEELFQLRDTTDKEENIVVFTHGLSIQALFEYLDSKQDTYELENFSFVLMKFSGNTARTKFLVGEKGAGVDGKRKLAFSCQHDQTHLNES